jgi:MtrB/PioB family decaheme-associated outer membrane protein
MKNNKPLLIITLAATAATSSIALAEEKPVEQPNAAEAAASTTEVPATELPAAGAATETPAEEAPKSAAKIAEEVPAVIEEAEPLVPEEFLSETPYSEIELGIGYVSDDAYKFGRYNGLQSKGPFVVADIDTENYSEDGTFWIIHGTNLGLESRYLRAEGGRQGTYKVFLEWDELPNYKNNTVQTPFLGVGSDNLTLPSGFDINTNLDASLNNFELKTKRERLTTGVMFTPKDRWQFDVDYSHETKKGVDATGAAIGAGPGGGGGPGSGTGAIGLVSTSLIPEPIDYVTDKVNAKLHYAGDDGQVDLTYHVSAFDNNYNSLTWQNPFFTTGAPTAGSMSLAPDNEFHQLSLSGGYTLPYRSRLTGLISIGQMTQNQAFESYSINSGLTTNPLPRSSLDGEVETTNAQLKIASRPTDKLRINGELRYNERDNQTPVASYDYIVLDSFAKTGSVQNNPYSYKKSLLNLDANYRISAIQSLRGGYKYNNTKRRATNIEREETKENSLFAKWKVKPHSTVDVELYGEASKRDGSEYTAQGIQNPGLRKYYMADRDRTQLGAAIDYMATEALFLSARADYNQDDYTDTTIGLTEASNPVYTLDFSYTPRHNVVTYGYYTHENIESSQAGASVTTATAASSNWEADFDDAFDTVGLGAKITDIGKWEIGADLVFSQSTGKIDMKDLVNPGTENQFPDNETELTSFKLWTNYNYNENLVYRLGYWFEDYSEKNWAYDGLSAYDPAVVENALLLGNTALDYQVHVVTVSASYKY